MNDDSAVVDDRLRLIFTCCHPALDPAARVALTLRMLGGLTTGEIARAFLVAEPTMGKRIVRAKRKIADAHIPYRVPGRRRAARPAARRAAGRVPDLQRGLCRHRRRPPRARRAVRRGDPPRPAAVPADARRRRGLGLLALMLLHDARRAARVDPRGRYVALRRAGPLAWDRRADHRGARDAGARRPRWGDRASTSCRPRSRPLHIEAPGRRRPTGRRSPSCTERWPGSTPRPWSSSTAPPRSAFAVDPRPAWSCSSRCSARRVLDDYQPLHAAHADLLRRAGDTGGRRAGVPAGDRAQRQRGRARRARASSRGVVQIGVVAASCQRGRKSAAQHTTRRHQ